jgi:hypothetical protein
MSGHPEVDPSALRRALEKIKLPLSNEARDSLRAEVFAYVDALKAAGRPPEHVILVVKKLAFDAGYQTTSHIVYSEKVYGPDALIVELVGWCIERYYGTRDDDATSG